MKKNQERCDGCGKWVEEGSLVWLYGTYDKNDKCVCKKCFKEKNNKKSKIVYVPRFEEA